MNRLWPTTHKQQPTHGPSAQTLFAPTQQPTHGDTRGPKAGCPQTHHQPAHAKHTTPTNATRTHATPTQHSTHGDTRGPQAGCPQTHNQPANPASQTQATTTTTLLKTTQQPTPNPSAQTRFAPTQHSTHGDTRGPQAGCPQTHNQPANPASKTPATTTTILLKTTQQPPHNPSVQTRFTPTQHSTRGPQAGCPQTHNQPANAPTKTPTLRKAA